LDLQSEINLNINSLTGISHAFVSGDIVFVQNKILSVKEVKTSHNDVTLLKDQYAYNFNIPELLEKNSQRGCKFHLKHFKITKKE